MDVIEKEDEIANLIKEQGQENKKYYKNSSSSTSYLIGLAEPLIEDTINITDLPLCEGFQTNRTKIFVNKQLDGAIGSSSVSEEFSIPDETPSDVSGKKLKLTLLLFFRFLFNGIRYY